MKTLLIILSFIVLESCNSGNTTPDFHTNNEKQINNKDSVRDYAEYILAGGQLRSIEDALLEKRIFDSINSNVDSSRDYYFKVSIYLLKNQVALVDPDLAKNIHTLIVHNPMYLLSSLKNSDKQIIEDIGICLGNYYRTHTSTPNKLVEEVKASFENHRKTMDNDSKLIATTILTTMKSGMKH